MDCDKERICSAVQALLAGQANPKAPRTALKKELMPEDLPITLTIVQKRFPQMKYQKIKCELPHPFRTVGSTEVCLLIKDLSKEKNFDQEIGVARFKELLRSANVSGITEVFTFTQLRGEYKAYEAKRKLLSRYGLFLADERIYGRLASVLGTKFFTKNKFPVSVNVTDTSTLAEEVQSAIESTYLTIQGTGPQCSITIASMEQPAEEIVDNAVQVVAFLKEKFPSGFQNIRSLYLKLGGFSLPVYIDAESPNAVPVEQPPKTRGFDAPAEEITTVNSGRVKVCRDGSIKLLKPLKKAKSSDKQN